jgi:hypothetical protein
MNVGRAERGEPAVEIGVGVGTGVAVAGNMGSPERLNYTVLGETVNLASRLCGAADAGQVLVSGATSRSTGVDAVPLGGRALKGFSSDVEVFAVEGPVRSTIRAGLVAGLALAVLSAAAAPLSAQESGGGLPTLEGLGLWWTSPSGAYQGGFSGRSDFELYAPIDSAAGLMTESDPFFAPRMRLFLDAFAGERLYASAELRVDRGETPTDGDFDTRIEQAFLRAAVLRTPLQVDVQLGSSCRRSVDIRRAITRRRITSFARRSLTTRTPSCRGRRRPAAPPRS